MSQYDRLRAQLPDLWITRLRVSVIQHADNDDRTSVIRSHNLDPAESIAEALARLSQSAGTTGSQHGLSGVFCYMEEEARQYTVDCLFKSDDSGAHRAVSTTTADPPDGIGAWIMDIAGRPSASVTHYHHNLAKVQDAPSFQEIRRTIGSDWLPVAAVTTIVVNREGKVLLQQRSDDKTWSPPGGAVDCGERIEAAASRELWEETGLHAVPTQLMAIRSGPHCAIEYPHGDQVWFVGFVFLMAVTGGTMNLASDETLDLQWFDPQRLPANMTPYNRACAEDVGVDRRTLLVD